MLYASSIVMSYWKQYYIINGNSKANQINLCTMDDDSSSEPSGQGLPFLWEHWWGVVNIWSYLESLVHVLYFGVLVLALEIFTLSALSSSM